MKPDSPLRNFVLKKMPKGYREKMAPDYKTLEKSGLHDVTGALVLYRVFDFKLFSLQRAPHRNRITINKRIWLTHKYAPDENSGLVEQIIAEHAKRAYDTQNPNDAAALASLRSILDESLNAAETAGLSRELITKAKNLGEQTGYFVDIWNRALDTSPETLKRLTGSDVKDQSRADAIDSFVVFCWVFSEALRRTHKNPANYKDMFKILDDFMTSHPSEIPDDE